MERGWVYMIWFLVYCGRDDLETGTVSIITEMTFRYAYDFYIIYRLICVPFSIFSSSELRHILALFEMKSQ